MSHWYSLHIYCSEPSETTFTSKSSNCEPRDGNCGPHAGLEETRNGKDWTLITYCARILVCGFARGKLQSNSGWIYVFHRLYIKKQNCKQAVFPFFFFFLLKKDNDGGQEQDIFKNKWQHPPQILTPHSQKNQNKNSTQIPTQLQAEVGRKQFLTLKLVVQD